MATSRTYPDLSSAIAAIEKPTQDALLAAQQRLQQGMVPPVMAPAPAQVGQGSPQTQQPPGPWDAVAQSRFAREFLPTREMDVGRFAALPFEQRAKLADEYIESRATAEKMTPEARKNLENLRDKVVYADEGGRAPSLAGRVFGDTLDAGWAGLRGFGTGAAAAGLSAVGAENAAEAVRQFQKDGQAADAEDFNASTRDVLRRRAFREEQRGDRERGVLEAVGDFGSDLVRAPGSVVGELVGGSLPSLAVALATRGRSLPVQGLGLGGLGAAGGLNVNEAVYQEGLNDGLTPEQARERANRGGAVAAQAGAGIVDAVGGRTGIEGLLTRGAGRGVRRTAGALAAEGAEGAAASAAEQISSNVAFDRSLGFDVPAAMAEGAAQEVVAGAALRPLIPLLNRGDPAQGAPSPSTLPIRGATPPATPAPTLADVNVRSSNPVEIFDNWVDTSQMDAPAQAAARDTINTLLTDTPGAALTPDILASMGVPMKATATRTPTAADTTSTVLGRVYAPSAKAVLDTQPAAPAPLDVDQTKELVALQKITGVGKGKRRATAEEATRIDALVAQQVLAGSALIDPDGMTTYELPDGQSYTGRLVVTNEVPTGQTKREPRIFIEPTDGAPAVRVMPESLGLDASKAGWATRLSSSLAAAQQNYNAQAKAAGVPAVASTGQASPSLQRSDASLTRRDDTGVPDVRVDPDIEAGIVQGQYADTVMQQLTSRASTKPKRGMATFLLEKLKRAQFLSGVDVPIQVVPNLTVEREGGGTDRASGVYTRPGDGTAAILLDAESGVTEEVIMHEVGHAVSMAHMETDPAKLNDLQRAARSDIESIHQTVLAQPWASMFEIPNAAEFVSEGWTNPRLQQAMKTTPYTKGLSVWGKFKESLRGLIGLDPLRVPDNAFEALLTASDALVRSGARDPMVGGVVPAINRRLLDHDTVVTRTNGDIALTIQGAPAGPDVSITNNTGDEVASLRTRINGDNLEVARVAVNPEYRGQGLARTMYESLARTGNDIVRSDEQLPDGAAMWDAFERSGFATDGVIVGRVRSDVPAGQRSPRRAPPSDAELGLTPQRRALKVQELIVEEAEAAQDTAMASRIDFIESSFDDEKGVIRGSAFLADPSADVWMARFFKPEGGQVTLAIEGKDNAEAWLQSFTKTNDAGEVTTRSTVRTQSKDTGYKNVYGSVIDNMSATTPWARGVYDLMLKSFIPPNVAFGIVQSGRTFSRMITSRSGALEAAGGQSLVNEFNRLRTEARAGINSSGFDFQTLKDMTSTLNAQVASLNAQGVPKNLTEEYLDAMSAIQSNALKDAEFPTDMAGRPRLNAGDSAKFSYYEGADGSLWSDPGPGRTLVSGPDAATRYVEAFNEKYGAARAELDAVLDGIRTTNKYVLDEQLANGMIGPVEHAKLVAQDLYLPRQQVKSGVRPSGFIRGATGRSTKAISPIQQWEGVLAARLDVAAYKGGLAALVRALQLNPNAAIASINTNDVTPVSHPDIDADGEVTNPSKLIAADWKGNDSVSVWLGDRQVRITFKDPVLREALRPDPTTGILRWPAVQGVLSAARMTTTMLVSTPAFWLKSATWDLVTPLYATQGSFDADGEPLSLAESAKLTAGIYKRIAPALGESIKASFVQAATGGLPRSADPMRNLYNARGGGVNLQSIHASHDALLQSQSTLGAVRGAGRKGFLTFTATGHVVSDAVRYASFKAYLEQANGGKFASEAALREFVADNPEAVDNATLGSKRLLGNYEDVGQQVLLRSVVPFFNAASVGMTQQIPKMFGTSQGGLSMAAFTGLAFLAAMAAGDDDDDRDGDGFGKNLRRNSSWESLSIGGTMVPIPHEMRFGLLAGNFAAAMMLNSQNKRQDMTDLTAKAIRTAYQTLVPLPGVSSAMEDRSLWSDFGPIGTLGQLALTDSDSFGGVRTNPDALRGEGRADPLYKHPNNGDSAAAVATSKALWDGLGMDIPPTSIEMLFRLPTGGFWGLYKEIEKGGADGRGAVRAMQDWMFKAYETTPDNTYSSRGRWDAEVDSLRHSEDLATRKDVLRTDERVREMVKGIRTTNRELANARRAGDESAYARWERDSKLKAARADAVRNQHYERTANANRNLLN